VKENKVYSGHYELGLKVSDLQEMTAVYKLSVTVCDCLNPTMPNCTIRKAIGSTVDGGSLGIAFFSMLLLLGKPKKYYFLLKRIIKNGK